MLGPKTMKKTQTKTLKYNKDKNTWEGVPAPEGEHSQKQSHLISVGKQEPLNEKVP